jgi:hypothetical protein
MHQNRSTNIGLNELIFKQLDDMRNRAKTQRRKEKRQDFYGNYLYSRKLSFIIK